VRMSHAKRPRRSRNGPSRLYPFERSFDAPEGWFRARIMDWSSLGLSDFSTMCK
jgi:hypothetical protein